MGRETPRKRILEHIVESDLIRDHSSQYRLADDENREGCSKRVCVAAQRLSGPDESLLEVRPQLTVDAHLGSVQPAQTKHPVLSGTATGLSELSSKDGSRKNVIAEQVCFGMVCILNSCHLLPLVTKTTPLDLSSRYLYSLTAFLFFSSNPTG